MRKWRGEEKPKMWKRWERQTVGRDRDRDRDREREREREREKAQSERFHVTVKRERCPEPLPVCYRLIEMG